MKKAVFGATIICACLAMRGAGAKERSVHAHDFYRQLSGETLGTLDLRYDLDLARFQMVTKQFGPTVIDMSQLPVASAMLDSGKRPWSSWWFQKSRREFTGGGVDSILARYDRVFDLSGAPSSAWSAEMEQEKTRYSPWEGLCDAWAMASLLYPEPKRPIRVMSENFSINDIKGLIIKSFEAVPDGDFTLFGEKFLGTADAWIYPDVFPDQFHRFVEVVLGQHHQAFIMDRDPGVEVWSIPVFKANYRIEKSPDAPNAVLVKMWLFGAGPHSFDLRNSPKTEEIVYQYVYELSGELGADQHLTVNSGKWLRSGFVDSRSNHPDFLLLPNSDKLQRASYNRNIDPKKVDRLVKASL